MSPQQAEGRKLDARSDIFSFGSVLYEMVIGRKPFTGDSRLSILSKILNEDPKPPGGSIPPELERIILRCLRKDPARRYQHMVDLKVALEDVEEESVSGALTRQPTTSRPRRGPWVVALAAVAFLAVAAALWFALSRPRPSEDSLTAIPLTTYAGRETSPSSPAGRQVAFSWNGENQDNWDIYVKLVDAGTPLRLTTNAATDYGPVWAPDGRYIAFLRSIGGDRSAVFQIPALGGPERKLAEIVIPSNFGQSFLSWSPRRQAASHGGSECVRGANRTGARPLTSDHRRVEGCAWTADGREIIFSSNRTGSSALWRITASGSSQPVRLPSVGDAAVEPAISRLGAGRRSWLTYVRTTADRDILCLDTSKGTETRVVSSNPDLTLFKVQESLYFQWT